MATDQPSEPGMVSDFDFHPSEPHVRKFQVPRCDVLRLDSEVYVSEAGLGDIVLRHYAFRNEWFKVNVTLDTTGSLIETAPDPGSQAYAFNCDTATPMEVNGSAVYSVDLFADVLVRADGVTHHVKDLAALEEATADGSVSASEAANARRGLDRLLRLTSTGKLVPFLEEVCPFGSSRAKAALPMQRVPLESVPILQPTLRSTWNATHGQPRTGYAVGQVATHQTGQIPS
jgi:hypothetical protein